MATSKFNMENDISKATNILFEMNENLQKAGKMLENLKKRIDLEELPTKDGLSILELKNQTFMSYVTNFSFTHLMKLSGVQFENNPTIDRLIEQRVLLEKIRPLEFKLRKQISNYAKAQCCNGPSSNVPKNSLDDISDSDNDGEEGEVTSNENKSGVYKAPKISQVAYPGDGERDDAQIKRDARQRKRLLGSDMMSDALFEHNEDPEEIHGMNAFKRKAQEKIRQIQSYEEENYTRLVLTKKEKHMLEQVSTSGNLASELLNFRALDSIGKKKAPSKNKKRAPKRRKR